MEITTLVLADDHPIVRRSMAAHLDNVRDIRVIGEAEDGYEALRLAEELRPDVLLLDIKMPGLSGIEVARRLRAHHSAVKIVVFSAYADAGRVQAMLDTNVEGYLTKEEPVDQVLEAIRGAARGEHGYYSREVKEHLLHRCVEQKEAAGNLTARELGVLKQVATGRTNRAIAHVLDISEKTVEKHLDHIYRKLKVSSRTEAAVAAVRGDMLPQGAGRDARYENGNEETPQRTREESQADEAETRTTRFFRRIP